MNFKDDILGEYREKLAELEFHQILPEEERESKSTQGESPSVYAFRIVSTWLLVDELFSNKAAYNQMNYDYIYGVVNILSGWSRVELNQKLIELKSLNEGQKNWEVVSCFSSLMSKDQKETMITVLAELLSKQDAKDEFVDHVKGRMSVKLGVSEKA